MMTPARSIRWIILLTALFASIRWSYVSIHHLLENGSSEELRHEQYGTTSPVKSERVKQIEAMQKQWGRQTMFAIACSFFFLLAVMMNWVLDGRPQRGGELK